MDWYYYLFTKPGSEVRLHLLKEIPEDPSLRQEWNALVSQVDQPQVFYTYEWAQAVYRAYGDTLRPLLFLAHDDNNGLRGVVALAADAERDCVSFLCATTGDYCDFLSLPEDRGPFVSGVLAELRKLGIHDLRLTNLPGDSSSVAAIRQAAEENRLRCHMRTAYLCAQVVLNALERRGQHNPVLPRKKMLRRFLNAMGRENPVCLDHRLSWEAIEPVLPEFIEAHVARFLVTGRISNMARPERRKFLAELARLMSGSGSVVLTRMMSGDRVFAWNYGFQFEGTWFWYQPTFDSDLEKYSPGFCLLAKVIEEASENASLQIVDLGLGAEDYKERFANRSRGTLYVSLKSSMFSHYAEIVRDQVSSLVRSSRTLEDAVRWLVTRLHRSRHHLRQLGVRGTLRELRKSSRELLWSDDEISYYQCSDSVRAREFQIQNLDLNHLAAAVTEYPDDVETLDYLLRSAQKLRSKEPRGIVLVNSERKPLHFAWICGFRQVDQSQVKAETAASGEDVLIVDAWTPTALRGMHYCTQALELIVAEAKQRGQSAWGCSGASSTAWIRALTKAGFQRRYGVRRRRVLGARIVKRVRTQEEFSAKEASARV